MQTLDRDERSRVIPAPPDLLWQIVSDVMRTPELSPEISACRWLDGANGPEVGVRFEATNTVNGKSWKNQPVVTAAAPGQEFAFARTEPDGRHGGVALRLRAGRGRDTGHGVL